MYADSRKCVSGDPGLLLRAARFTTGVGQEPAPSKCVPTSTSRVVRKDMKDWVLSQGVRNGLSILMSGTSVCIWRPPSGDGLLLLLPGFGWLFLDWSFFHSSIGFPWWCSGGQDYVHPRCSPWH